MFYRQHFQLHFREQNFSVLILLLEFKFVSVGPIDNKSELIQVITWQYTGEKLLIEPVMATISDTICHTRPQWINDTLQLMSICTT